MESFFVRLGADGDDRPPQDALAWAGGLSLAFVEGGSPILRSGKTETPIIGACLLCINETERPTLAFPDGSSTHPVSRVFFSPQDVNGELSLERVRNRPETLSESATLDADFLRPFIDRNDAYRGLVPVGPDMAPRVRELITSLSGELNAKRDNFWPCRSRSYFLELLLLVYKEYLSAENPLSPKAPSLESSVDGDGDAGNGALAARAIRLINREYAREISLGVLCDRLGTNRTTLGEAIRKATGASAMEYVTRTRINAACVLLRDTSLPVSEVSERAGFNDLAHFGRAFRKTTGIPPSDYRALHRKPAD